MIGVNIFSQTPHELQFEFELRGCIEFLNVQHVGFSNFIHLILLNTIS